LGKYNGGGTAGVYKETLETQDVVFSQV